jgi:hypothetical protein
VVFVEKETEKARKKEIKIMVPANNSSTARQQLNFSPDP